MKTSRDISSDQCIDDARLAKYIGGCSSDNERKQVEKHLSSCKDCLDTLMLTNSLINDTELSEYEPVSEKTALSAMKRWNLCRENEIHSKSHDNIAEIFKKIYQWITSLINPLQPALQRSSKQSSAEFQSCANHTLLKVFENFDAEFGFEKSGDDSANITVNIARGNENIIRLTLESSTGEDIDSRPVRGNSEIFESLVFGDYRLIFRKDALEEADVFFTVNATGIHEK